MRSDEQLLGQVSTLCALDKPREAQDMCDCIYNPDIRARAQRIIDNYEDWDME